MRGVLMTLHPLEELLYEVEADLDEIARTHHHRMSEEVLLHIVDLRDKIKRKLQRLQKDRTMKQLNDSLC